MGHRRGVGEPAPYSAAQRSWTASRASNVDFYTQKIGDSTRFWGMIVCFNLIVHFRSQNQSGEGANLLDAHSRHGVGHGAGSSDRRHIFTGRGVERTGIY